MQTIARTLLATLALAAFVQAQSITSVSPACGAPGDKVLIRGEDFGDDPSVTIGGEEAVVLGSRDGKILIAVPEGLEAGAVTLSVGDTDADDDFTLLDEGAPVVHRLSTATATPGLRILVVGLRLSGAEAEFVDGDDEVAATVELKGYRRAGFLEIPDDLAAGTYTLRLTNDDDLDTGACSPEIEIVDAGDATLDSIEPEARLPGETIRILGSDLSPAGPVHVSWTDEDGETLETFGFSNGFDRVYSRVPFRALAGTTYDVAVELRDGTETEAVSYEVGALPVPTIDAIAPEIGPAGSVFRLTGAGLFAFSEEPTVTMSAGETSIEAKVLFRLPGFFGDDLIVAQVPDDAADGEYDVTVTIGAEESNAVTFEGRHAAAGGRFDDPGPAKAFRPPGGGGAVRGRVALVTGAGGGLGRTFAQALAKAGAAVTVTGRTKATVEATAAAIGGRAFACDVTDEAAMAEVVARIGPVDLLVNNAATMGATGADWELAPDDWWRALEINLKGAFIAARLVLPAMVERGHGRIVNVSSGAATLACPGYTAYAASKAALNHWTHCLAESVRDHGVSIFALGPGFQRTPGTEQAADDPNVGEIFQQLFATGAEAGHARAAGLLLHLASGRADEWTGRYIDVQDGKIPGSANAKGG